MEDDMIGKRFGRLVVVDKDGYYISPSGSKHSRYKCECDCGNTVVVLKEHMTSGRTKSCGCLRMENGKIKHGQIHTRLYTTWGNMVNRCTNPNNPAWENYGGRGITVCDEWRSFESFYKWAIESGYKDHLTIDRKDNSLGYCPENCRWSDRITQANNKRNNHKITFEGQTKTIAEWSKCLGIPYKVLHERIVTNRWDINRAFTQHVRLMSSSDC